MKNVIVALALLLCVSRPVWAQNHTATVVEVKSALVSANVDLSGPCGAFAITGRVAYVLRAEGFGLIAKNPGQNGCETVQGRFAVDALALSDGTAFDILINAETQNTPAWQLTGATSPANWRAPFEMPFPGVEPPHPQPTPDNPDHDVIIALMGDLQKQMTEFRTWAETEIASVRAENKALYEKATKIDLSTKGSTFETVLRYVVIPVATALGAKYGLSLK